MPKAEAKRAAQFTRMCKFWRTNECKMGAECTFAHSTAELRQSPKPCFDFVKTGFCARGQACRFVHAIDVKAKAAKCTELPSLMVNQSAIVPDEVAEMAFLAHLTPPTPFSSMNSGAQQFTMSQCGPMNPPAEADIPMNAFLRPPSGSRLAQQYAEPGLVSQQLPHSRQKSELESRRSSFSELSFGLERFSLPGSEEANRPHEEAAVATQSLASTFCLSATPSNFSDLEGYQAHSQPFWI
mmetsp:Transcript_42554/g.99224  ORF Transcript_42554/g.99224 Transcript_42554/m.99224 type:complete len:240 (-) Transcript_42554:158-877(-)